MTAATAKRVALGGFVALLLCSSVTNAQLFKRDLGDEIVLPDEEALVLPPPPKSDALLSFDPAYLSPFTFSIDPTSLRVGADRIVRYTLVVKAQSGATNVSYEALRCDTNERKIFAYGTTGGEWSPVRDPQWKPLVSEPYRNTLFHSYFCPRNLAIRTPLEGLEAIRAGGHPRAVATQN
jgi:hypothetical protein